MPDYDIKRAFERIENELIASMIRNMKKHREWEDDEGFDWEQWQAIQLKNLAAYKRRNQKVFGKKFKVINKHLEEAIRKAREDGHMAQELELLEMVKSGKFKKPRISKKKAKINAEFFNLNDRKMEALIKATVSDMERAEVAILRMANDKYRKVIFDAQVYANSGAGTYEKAIDMATRDFLAAGLNCVEYKNGARHTLKDYADMALRTASKRAYLTGEGEVRKEWGICTVQITKRGNPCPLCLPFIGKVMIDDVWSDGPSNGISPETGKKYPLMSDAISAGLYHPRCQDDHSTFYEGLDEDPDDKFTKKEIEEIEEENKTAAEKQYAQRQVERFGRLATFSLDQENKAKYQAKSDEWVAKVKGSLYLAIKREGIYDNETYIEIENKARVEIERYPKAIKDAMEEYSLVIGSYVNAIDTEEKIVYFGKDMDRYIFDHEIGHFVEKLFINEEKLRHLKKEILKNVTINDIITEIRFDAEGNPVPVIYVENDEFYTTYQGRIHVGDEGLDGIFDAEGDLNVDEFWEIVSETMPHYMNGEKPPNPTIAKIYSLIEEAFNEK